MTRHLQSVRLVDLNDSGWQVPASETTVYFEQAHSHTIVIPVINEGQRIQAQLRRIHEAGLPMDVVIADGGSPDGSLMPDLMRTVGVRALLSKTGRGTLSAQLRMAYAWCLLQIYTSIVTVDGNGRDGAEAVTHMVLKLMKGFDYVHGWSCELLREQKLRPKKYSRHIN